MLKNLGHTVYLYAAESSDAPCTELIQTHSLEEIRKTWGDSDRDEKYPRQHFFYETGYDWKREIFRHDFSTEKAVLTKEFYRRSIDEIIKRKRDDHFLLLTQGIYHREIEQGVNLYLTCEPGVGYTGSYAKFRAFESTAVMHYTYGRENAHDPGFCDGKHYDRVIPYYYDPEDFHLKRKKEDYFLYIGRLIRRKGLGIAHLVCKHLNKKLVIAGQGCLSWDGQKLTGIDITLEGGNIEYVGTADPEERDQLMGRATALFLPTLYIEPFGGVHVEAQLCGTPVITTDHGVFVDTVINGINGYRCHTLNDFVRAARKVNTLKPDTIRRHASRFLIDTVQYDFQKWFEDLYRVWLSTKVPQERWLDGNGTGWFWKDTRGQ